MSGNTLARTLLFAIAVGSWAGAATAQEAITVAWDRNPETDIQGYTLFAGSASGVYTSSQDVGNVVERTMTLPPGTYYFAVRAYNRLGLTSQLSSEVSVKVAAVPQPATGRWQAVWQHASGALSGWTMAGTRLGAGGTVGTPSVDPVWQIRTTGDMDGDGHRDILFQHTDGLLAVWLMAGDALKEARLLNPLSDKAWRLAAAADLDADGETDLIFQHSQNGTIAAWLMNGTGMVAARTIARITDNDWRIVAAADINLDGSPDLFWQNLRTGIITTWLMKQTTMAAAGPFSVYGPSDPKWRLQGVTDVNGDGQLDLVWRHATLGNVATWLLTGRTVVDATLLTPSTVSLPWRLAAIR